LRLLATHARCYGPLAGHACLAELAASAVHGHFEQSDSQASQVRYYLERRDPEFDKRKAKVLEVFTAAEMLRALPEAERPVATLSYDEKPGIQAIATTAPGYSPAARSFVVFWHREGSIGSLAAAAFQASSPDTFKRVVTFLSMLRHLSMFKRRGA
jgi:hypothetical protein